MAIASNLGYPRIGPKRELKTSLEQYWDGQQNLGHLLSKAREIKKSHWILQKDFGIDHIPSNDFSPYDHVLDTVAMVGAVPKRFVHKEDSVDWETYFSMARGIQGKKQGKQIDAPAMEMTKWFDTNYHYIVPELSMDQNFYLGSIKPLDDFEEALTYDIKTRPVLLGPVTFLRLSKCTGVEFNPLSLLDGLLEVYAQMIGKLKQAGVEWLQIDEPILVLNLDEEERAAIKSSYSKLFKEKNGLKILIASYFGSIKENMDIVFDSPVDALHLDLIRSETDFQQALFSIPKTMMLSMGLVDGRNVWKTDLYKAIELVEEAYNYVHRDQIMIAPSCPMLFVPEDLELETKLPEEVKNYLSFAKQKIQEISLLTQAINHGENSVKEALKENQNAIKARKTAQTSYNKSVRERTSSIAANLFKRNSSFKDRKSIQENKLKLPVFPTTTIGSYPQTQEVRKKRAGLKSGKISLAEYENFIKKEIEETIRFQEKIGLDVLVHGEFERSDMVEYFGEQLSGIAFTNSGWVQSYGSRCVRPPIIYGDVDRPNPMTVEWSKFAQSLTPKPIKGMLTGPITILQWSFVRDDQPRSETCFQIAFAIRDEVKSLEEAGISIIQIDEPALREGLPLRREEWDDYLDWGIKAFHIASSGVKDETQIHTHMCYSEFNDIIKSIAAMDADVISIEASRSKMELLEAFKNYNYPNDIGPGVYDIHSPRIPTAEEMVKLLNKARDVLSDAQLWVNPDCGLKTRKWEEIKPSLENMVKAAIKIRKRYK